MAGVLKYQEDVAQHMRRPQTEVSQEKGAIAQAGPGLIADIEGPDWRRPDVEGPDWRRPDVGGPD